MKKESHQHHDRRSLSEVHASVDTIKKKGFWKKLFAFMGPAYLVSVGYMDPGNWATDIAGGSRFGYELIWVLLMSNIMALLLQSLSARLGIVRKLDLAQASRAHYPQVVNFFLYILAEIAIAACDLAEVLGMAIGLNLLVGLPLLWGVGLSVLDTLLFLVLQNYGMRKMEAFIVSLVGIIGAAFVIEIFFAKPDIADLAKGFIPTLRDSQALYIAIGIIGATVMPHNLYLHSSLVQTRNYDNSSKGIRSAIRFNIFDSTIALNLAFFVNAAILILAAATFYAHGMYDVQEIQDAYKLLSPLLGTTLASTLFAVALIAAGQSSTITGTLAGQIVMEGYLHLRIQPWLRRLLTRLIAIVPAFAVIYIYGESETGPMLILSQVILSMQLGFAIIPLIHFVSDREKMGEFTIRWFVKVLAWIITAVIVALNIKLVFDELHLWVQDNNSWIPWATGIPIAIACLLLLIYITVEPFVSKYKKRGTKTYVHGTFVPLELKSEPALKKIAVSLDFSFMDSHAMNGAIAQGGKEASYVLIHIVETVGAKIFGHETHDFESEADSKRLLKYRDQLREAGYDVTVRLGFGNPKQKIPQIATQEEVDLLVMGVHGHKLVKDLLFGTTVDAVRHRLNKPILIVNNPTK